MTSQPRNHEDQLISLAPWSLPADFAQIVAEAPLWYELFLQRGARVMPPATFGEVLGLALDNGGLFRCDALRASVQDLAKRDAAAAERLAAHVARRCR